LDFARQHKDWLGMHLSLRKGEARRKLKDGHGHAEIEFLRYVWWPAFGHFEHLHPEYEVKDYFDGKRYLDFAYIRSGVHFAIEVDPYGTHYDKINRRQYANQWVRHMHLLNDSWLVTHISLDDVKDRPRLWQQLFQQMIGRLFGDDDTARFELSGHERDVLRTAFRLDRPIKLTEVRTVLQCGYETARKQIRSLEDKKWLVPVGKGTARTHAWHVDLSRKPPLL